MTGRLPSPDHGGAEPLRVPVPIAGATATIGWAMAMGTGRTIRSTAAAGAVLIGALALAGCITGLRRQAPKPPSEPASVTGRPAPAGDLGAAVVARALTVLDQPYRYGGAAPGGFDCSGLVNYAFNGAGVAVPRTAWEQLHAGARISRQEVRPGDLVFMRLAHKELHVGIVVDAGHFIHAPSTGGRVRVDTLDAPTYARGFLEARRITSGAAADAAAAR